MYLTQKNHVRGLTKQEYTILNLICRLSKNLYNVTNYAIRQFYETNGKYFGTNGVALPLEVPIFRWE